MKRASRTSWERTGTRLIHNDSKLNIYTVRRQGLTPNKIGTHRQTVGRYFLKLRSMGIKLQGKLLPLTAIRLTAVINPVHALSKAPLISGGILKRVKETENGASLSYNKVTI